VDAAVVADPNELAAGSQLLGQQQRMASAMPIQSIARLVGVLAVDEDERARSGV
jgi:hypothetical protein